MSLIFALYLGSYTNPSFTASIVTYNASDQCHVLGMSITMYFSPL